MKNKKKRRRRRGRSRRRRKRRRAKNLHDFPEVLQDFLKCHLLKDWLISLFYSPTYLLSFFIILYFTIRWTEKLLHIWVHFLSISPPQNYLLEDQTLVKPQGWVRVQLWFKKKTHKKPLKFDFIDFYQSLREGIISKIVAPFLSVYNV